MTPDNSSPRKRRRRRRRGGTGESQPPQSAGNGNTAAGGRDSLQGGSDGQQFRRRRRRSRRRGRDHVAAPYSPEVPAIDLPPGELAAATGVLFLKPNGGGILVSAQNNYVAQPGDPTIPRGLIERMHLDPGLEISGSARRAGNGLELVAVEQIEGMPIEEYRESRRPFSELISIDPVEMFKLETESERLTTRVLDLLSPLGKGQRCLIVAPPKAGKTTLLKDIAHGVNMNHPECVLIVLLVDERPEEVTDFRRSVAKGDVIASSSDETAENHIQIAEVVLDRARRLVELKKDVVILCDSITRMSRAYNNEQRGSGKILSGGIDARTMEKPRRFFGAARKAEEWGSLTIIATALVDTGSRMD